VDKFHGDVLCVGSVWALPKGKQATATQKALRHLTAGFGEAANFGGKVLLEDLVA
jgi:hypothetical protein